MSGVTRQVSGVRCHMSGVACHIIDRFFFLLRRKIFLDNILGLFGGSVIIGASPVKFFTSKKLPVGVKEALKQTLCSLSTSNRLYLVINNMSKISRTFPGTSVACGQFQNFCDMD